MRSLIDQAVTARRRRQMAVDAGRATVNTTGDFNDQRAGAVFDLAPQADTLLVAFGGIAGKLGVPVFEFFKVTGSVPVKRAFLRDHHRAWYHRGVAGATRNISETADLLRSATKDCGRTVMVGNSAGGYAALLFGELVGADAVIAFAPQTFLSEELRVEHGDDRWASELAALGEARDDRYLDLLDVLTVGRRDVYYSANDPLDTVHAKRLDGLATLHRRDAGAHDLVKRLRDSGELREILADVL